MTDVYDRVKVFLNSKSVEVPREWIVACIDFLQSEYTNQPANAGWLAEKAYEQWKFTDVAELGCGSLPPELAELTSAVLDKDYALQINSLRDVGQPAYSQLQKLRKEDMGNNLIDTDKPKQQAWEPKASRQLLLAVTDGVTQLQAMEYTPVPVLSLHIKPGTKILVRRGVAVRRGIMLLTPAHVTVLGGAADELLVPNAPENVIHRALGLEETQSPLEYEDPPPTPALPPSQASQYYPGTQPPSQRSVAAAGRGMSVAPNRNVPGRNAVPNRNVPGRNGVPNGSTIPSRSGNNAASQNTSNQMNNFSNLWNNSQAFGRPADSQQSSVDDPLAAFDDDDDFMDMDVEAALMEAETQHASRTTLSNTFSKSDSSASRNPSMRGRSETSTNQSRRGGMSVHSNATPRASNSVPGAAAPCRPGMSINLSNINHNANPHSVKKPENNPFIDADFADDCFGDEDFSALEEEVKLIESQEHHSISSSAQSSTNEISIVSECSGNNKDTIQRNSTFQKPLPKRPPQLNRSANSSNTSLTNSTSTRFCVNSVDSNRKSSDGNDNASLASKIKAMVHSESSYSVTTTTPLPLAGPPKTIASSSVASSKRSFGERETARVSPMSHTGGSSASTSLSSSISTGLGSSVSTGLGSSVSTGLGSSVSTRLGSSVSTGLGSSVSTGVGSSVSTGVGSSTSTTLNSSEDQSSKDDTVTNIVQTKPPFTYLSFLPEQSSSEKEFVVKGFVMTLVSRLDSNNGQWNLRVKVNDGTRSMDVDIHDQVLRRLLGMSVPEMRAYKAKASTDPSIKAMLLKSVSECQKELISMCCLMTLRVSPSTPRPTLVTLTPFQDCHAQQLADRAVSS